MSTAIVVGSGPNGLAAALTLAEKGVGVTVLEACADIGGGTRTSELTVPGLLHDDCSAVHPMAAASPFIQSQHLDDYGLRGATPTSTWLTPSTTGVPLFCGRRSTTPSNSSMAVMHAPGSGYSDLWQHISTTS
jgi:phytoene dehydrogenase-like protein